MNYPYRLPPPMSCDGVHEEWVRGLTEYDKRTVQLVHHLNMMLALQLPDTDREGFFSDLAAGRVQRAIDLIDQMGTAVTDWAGAHPRRKSRACMVWMHRALGSFQGLSRNLGKYLLRKPDSRAKTLWKGVDEKLKNLVGVLAMMQIMAPDMQQQNQQQWQSAGFNTRSEEEGGVSGCWIKGSEGDYMELDLSPFER